MTYTLDKFYSIVNIITIKLIFDFHHLSLFQYCIDYYFLKSCVLLFENNYQICLRYKIKGH